MKPYLVFTCAGDRTRFYDLWLTPDKSHNFDLFVCYYGENVEEDPYHQYADFYLKRKGAKFQNLHHIYLQDPSFFSKYSHIFVLDDDIEISSSQIEEMFSLAKQYKLWICQPSFDVKNPRSLISHPITGNVPGYTLRFTNFVEMNTMLFNTECFHKCMENFTPELCGWGTDWLFLWMANDQTQDKYQDKFAIIDAVICLNPKQRDEHRIKEIDTLQTKRERKGTWSKVAKRLGIPSWTVKLYSTVKQL
jgi:hypothetical protein